MSKVYDQRGWLCNPDAEELRRRVAYQSDCPNLAYDAHGNIRYKCEPIHDCICCYLLTDIMKFAITPEGQQLLTDIEQERDEG
jgi:hypothetical protein